MATVLAFGDLHAPNMHPDAAAFLCRVADDVRPDVVVCTGDELDCHRFSRHTHSPETPGPADELQAARERLRPIFSLFPRCLVVHSNHTRRIAMRAAEAGLPGSCMMSVKDIIGAPAGWEWDDRVIVDGVEYRHGDGFSGQYAACKARDKLHRSVVLGHLHSQGGVWYSRPQGGRRIFGAAAGCLIDEGSPAFEYARFDAARPVLGAVVVYDGSTAYFMPMD